MSKTKLPDLSYDRFEFSFFLLSQTKQYAKVIKVKFAASFYAAPPREAALLNCNKNVKRRNDSRADQAGNRHNESRTWNRDSLHIALNFQTQAQFSTLWVMWITSV